MQPRWMRRVVEGSVLREGSGTMRIVRRVSRKPNGDLWGVTFTIRHCSWTGRCYTVVTASDLKTRGFSIVPVRPRRLRSQFDDKIRAAMAQGGRPSGTTHDWYVLRCCDVEGVS